MTIDRSSYDEMILMVKSKNLVQVFVVFREYIKKYAHVFWELEDTTGHRFFPCNR
jgi:hypothetical protein